MARISTKQVISMTVKELRSHLREQSANLSFSTLSRYRKALLANAKPAEAGDDGAVAEGAATEEAAVDQDKKARAVYALLRERVDTGEPVKRRKAGTGAKREIQVPYKDTLANRKAGRVGTSYSKVVYDDAVVEEVPRKLRKQKRVIDPSRKRTGNAWIKAVSAALPMLSLMPTSGVDLDNAGEYLTAGAFGVGLVAPLFPPDKIAAGDWDAIHANAVKVIGKVNAVGPMKK
jgi:hypothetical protein